METPCIYELIECMSALIRAEERKQCTALGLQAVHFQVMHYLARCNKYSDTPAVVATYLGMTRGTVSQTLIILERNGYIIKRPDSRDRRIVHLSLSDTGLALLQQARPDALFKQATRLLAANEPNCNSALFQHALTALQKAHQSHTFGVCKTCQHFSEVDGGYLCQLTQEPLTLAESTQICLEHCPA